MQQNIYRMIGKNVKKYRLKNKLSSLALAELTGYSHEFIRSIESPKSTKGFSIEAIYQIAKALKIKMAYLFEGVY